MVRSWYSVILASAVESCQSTHFWIILHSDSQTSSCLLREVMSQILRFKPCEVVALSTISAIFSQLPRFGV